MAEFSRWTTSAINCYKRGCVCSGCFYDKFFSGKFKCRMRLSVIELVKSIGIPKELENDDFIDE